MKEDRLERQSAIDPGTIASQASRGRGDSVQARPSGMTEAGTMLSYSRAVRDWRSVTYTPHGYQRWLGQSIVEFAQTVNAVSLGAHTRSSPDFSAAATSGVTDGVSM